MGNIYKRGKVWYIDVRSKGRRIRKKIGSSKKIAMLALQDAEVKIARDEYGFGDNDIALDKFIERFIEYSQANHREATTKRYSAVIDHFQTFITTLRDVSFISEVTTEVIDRYKIYRKSSWVNGNGHPVENENEVTNKTRKGARAHTINFEVDTLRMIFNLAIKWDYLKENPTKGVKRLKVDDSKPPRFLTKEECQKLLEASPPELYPVYFTFLNTGMRKAELENLQWSDIDLKRERIRIRRKENWQPKTGERELPINDKLLQLLIDLRKQRNDSTDYVFDIINSGHSHNWLRLELIKIARKAGIKDLTKIHTLRHTFASHLVMNGVDLPTVKRLMGHTDIQTTMIYAHLAPEHLSDAVNKLSLI
ncbi:MAG: site-specific integrase [candidate division Zixibacteria bacterium]|nr:site-specific integrase [candidate division Zixibacteria bacterium]